MKIEINIEKDIVGLKTFVNDCTIEYSLKRTKNGWKQHSAKNLDDYFDENLLSSGEYDALDSIDLTELHVALVEEIEDELDESNSIYVISEKSLQKYNDIISEDKVWVYDRTVFDEVDRKLLNVYSPGIYLKSTELTNSDGEKYMSKEGKWVICDKNGLVEYSTYEEAEKEAIRIKDLYIKR